MTSKTATPMTDAKWHQCSDELPFTIAATNPMAGLGEIVPADFARKLESDRARLIEALQNILENTASMKWVEARSLLRELEGK